MSRHTFAAGLITFAAIFALAFSLPVSAGQFKRLNTASLAVGASLAVHGAPLNQGSAMEMDTYEFLTSSAGGNYRLRITSNSTGRALNLRLIGVNGSIITSCVTAVNGTCNTPVVALGGNLLFQGIVATAAGQPVNSGAHYIFAVQH